jgi:hypothetical protein
MANTQKSTPIKVMVPQSPVIFDRKEPTLKVKQTSPGVMKVDIGKAKPSRPQNKERMSTGGSKARMRHKGRTDPKAANPMDPGPNKRASTKVNWPTNDKNAQRGYVVGKAWPMGNKTTGEFEDAAAVTAPHA